MIINMNGAKAPETPSPVLQEKTVTPQTLPVVIGADEGYTGLSQVTVNPDSQLIPTNIRSGKTIFGVTGVFTGGETVGMTTELLDSFSDFCAINPNTDYSWFGVGSCTTEAVDNSHQFNVVYVGTKVTGHTVNQIYLTTMKETTNRPTHPFKFVYTLDNISSLVGGVKDFEVGVDMTSGRFTAKVRAGMSLNGRVYASKNTHTITGTCSLARTANDYENRTKMTITSIDQNYAINETWYCKYEKEDGTTYNPGLYVDWIMVEATE